MINKQYWEENIYGFSGFYDKKSEENIIAPYCLSLIYKKFFFPIEKKYMLERYQIVCDYIEKNVHRGMTVADIGCGSGIFVEKMANIGAQVYAIDYTESALSLVQKSIPAEVLSNVKLMQIDITEQCLPNVDLAISIGVLTYINEINKYLDNILPFTKKFLFNYLNATNILNRLRRMIPLLDVRRLTYHDPEEVITSIEKRNFKVNRIQKIATGFIIDSEFKCQH